MITDWHGDCTPRKWNAWDLVSNALHHYERGGNRTKHLGEQNVMLGAERLYWDEVEDKVAEGVWGQVMGRL